MVLDDHQKMKNESLDRDLLEFIAKHPIPQEPVMPPEITFPFMMVFYRKKISDRNTNYLVAIPMFSLADVATSKRNIGHKGWKVMTMIFDIPEFMLDDKDYPRYIHYKFHNWDDIVSILSDQDKTLLPQLKELYPCDLAYFKEKTGQLKFIL